jgi:hypothetical protein
MPEIHEQTAEELIASLRDRCQALQLEVLQLRQPRRAVEKYFAVGEVALLLSLSADWVRRKVASGEFAGVIRFDQEIRIPASSVNAFLDAHRDLDYPSGVSARTTGELRRRVRGRFEQEAAA